ncbi:MAG: right-handed parallel beta-helix repeat-containing protein [Bacteroidales bacterium]|nr:right-handed parallel beta-helix repeat-containing protein [Bacteroidales bacterium]
MKIKYWTWMMAAAALLAAGCDKDKPVPAEPGGGTEQPEPEPEPEPDLRETLLVDHILVYAGDNLPDSLAKAKAEGKDVLVSEGTYTGCFEMVEGVDVTGGWKADFSAQDPARYKTVLDADRKGRTLDQAADFTEATVWKDLGITGGYLSGDNGAGAYLRKNGRLDGCEVYGNRTETGSTQGGGVWAAEGSVLSGCHIHGNFAQNAGGGVYSKGLVHDSLIEDNTAQDNVGGGIQLHGGSAASNTDGTMYNCIIRGNAAPNAGGVRLWGCTQVASCVVSGNTATEKGVSGILCNGVTSLLNCTIAGNYDAATAAGNSSALYINQNGTLKNNLVYGNYSASQSAAEAVQVFVNHQYTWLMNNAVREGGLRKHASYDPNGNGREQGAQSIPVDGDGIFADFPGGDYHLTEQATMCIDKGNAALFGFMVLDAGGAPRRYGPVPDIGAYEYPAPVPDGGVPCVIIGDSIFDRWDGEDTGHPAFFTDNGIVDSGISGQTTDQMLLRFDGSVLYYRPKVVVIYGGTNDLTRVQETASSDAVVANITAMADRAAAYGAKVILCTILPCNATQTGSVSPKELIRATNDRLKALADGKGYGFLDFYTPLSAEDGAFLSQYHSDGTHPNADGYTVMEGILLPAVQAAL